MSEIDSIIAEFLNDAPAGETRDVINDLKLILDQTPDITKSIKRSLESSLVDQDKFEIISLPDAKKLSIISKYNKKGTKFYDSRLKKLFNVQFLDNSALDVEDEEDDEESTALFKSLATSLEKYVSEHYPLNNSQKLLAFDLFQLSATEIAIALINTKRNASNFINGTWVSAYKYNSETGVLKGNISIDVHYFEDGNVRLKTSKSVESSVAAEASEIITLIKKEEESYELALNKKFLKLNEVDFKSLRRPLPVTRAKVNWGKAIGNYRLGKDVNQA